MKIFKLSNYFLVIAMMLSGCVFLNTSKNSFAHYGKWQTYSSSQVLHYPDFDLLFKSERVLENPNNLPLGPVYDFSVTSSSSHTSVSWSTGLGDIGPSLFEIDGKKFYLEMLSSDHIGHSSSENQVVIWPESEFISRKHRWWFW